MSAPDTGYHAPIDIDAPVSLAAHRARRQRPGHWADQPTREERDAAEAREEDSRRLRFLGPAALVAVVVLLVLIVLAVRHLLGAR